MKKERLNKNLFAVIIFSVLIIFTSNYSIYGQKASGSIKAGEQKKAEKGLKDDRYYIYYINSTITNFGTDEEKNIFADAVKRDIVAQFFYLRYMFTEAYREIRTTQKTLIGLYRKKIDDDYEQVMMVFNGLAAQVINEDDFLAKEYLRLGYRNAKTALIEKNMADHYKLSLFSMRLHKYTRSMKRLKESKRYAVLTLIRLNIDDSEKIKQKKYSFEEISAKLGLYSPPENLDQWNLMHLDSYYKVKGDKSYFDDIWENPDLENYDVFKKYLKSSE